MTEFVVPVYFVIEAENAEEARLMIVRELESNDDMFHGAIAVCVGNEDEVTS